MFLLHISRRTPECHISLIITAWTTHIKVLCHILNSIVNLRNGRQCWYLKAVVSFYGIDSETAFECHRSRIPICDVNTVLVLKNHLISFLDRKELFIWPRRFWCETLSHGSEIRKEERQFCLNYGRAMESGASDHAGWNRKWIKQYVLEWFGI